MNETNDRPRGFAAMSPEMRSRISALGGKAAHAKGSAHQWTRGEARIAGALGATVRNARRKAAPC